MKLCALWHGDKLSWMEQLCLTSALDVGHEVDLYAYSNVGSVPRGVTLRDAAEVMPRELMVASKWRAKSKKEKDSFAHGSDIFRLYLQAQRRGCYIDCDMLLLKPIAEEENIFGWQGSDLINNAVLRLPPNSPIIADILGAIAQSPIILPWWPRKMRWRQWRRSWKGRDMKLGEIPLTTLGPRAMTPLVQKHGLVHLAKTPDVFYPIDWTEAPIAFEPGPALPGMTEKTVGVHLWNSSVKLARHMQPVEGSFMAEQCARLGVYDPRWRIAAPARQLAFA